MSMNFIYNDSLIFILGNKIKIQNFKQKINGRIFFNQLVRFFLGRSISPQFPGYGPAFINF